MMDQTYTTPIRSDERQDLIYKTVGDTKLDLIFLPPTEKRYDRAPVYFVIPGGGWHTTSAQSMVGFSAKSIATLRARGWAVASISYRLTPHAVIDEIISDCMDGGRYLAHFSDVLGIDPKRVLVSGHSAGGHLALMVSHAPHAGFTADSPFDAVADDFIILGSAPMSPITYLYDDIGGNGPVSFRFERLFKDSVYDLVAAHRASPLDYITPLSVPTLLMCGTHDTLVYPDNCVRFYDRSRALGAPCEILYSHLGGHCFEPLVEGAPSYPGMGEIQDRISAFAEQFE
jgi:acetyl esterase/lipase